MMDAVELIVRENVRYSMWLDNYNYQNELPQSVKENWPRKGLFSGAEWYHSDIKNVAYYYVYPLFKKIVQEGK